MLGFKPTDYRTVSRIHFDELGNYLSDDTTKADPNSRTTARQKLTRLTASQFHELSTDVYDELVRRQKTDEAPCLCVREGFHPKRNQARQKLATLPTSRMKDLCSDVWFELARRYPEFKGNTDVRDYKRQSGATSNIAATGGDPETGTIGEDIKGPEEGQNERNVEDTKGGAGGFAN